jgi:hypothetical protein
MVSWAGRELGRSKVCYRTVNPTWNFKVKFTLSRAEWDAAVEDFNLCANLCAEPPDSTAAMQQRQSPPPTLLEHLEMLFRNHDADGSGELEWDEFWQVLSALNLDLGDDDMAAWQAFADADGSGTVRWSEFAALEGDLLGLLQSKPNGGWEAEHTLYHAQSGRPFTLHRTSGATTWVPTARERRAAARRAAQSAQERRRGPPVVVRVVDFNNIDEHGTMGVSVVRPPLYTCGLHSISRQSK